MNLRHSSFGPALTAALLGLFTISFAVPASAEKKVKIKLGTLAPRGSKWLDSIEKMGRRWEQESGGKVSLKVYPGGVSGDESDVIRKMRIGQLQAATVTNLGLGSIDRSTIALQIPMMFRSYEELDHARDSIGPDLAKLLEEKGFVVLEWGDAGWVHFFSKAPVRTPEEMKKQKLFVWTGDPHAEAAWRAAGFEVVPTAGSDVLQGLQTGRIEAFATVPLYALASQWFGLAKNMLAVKWAPLSGATVVDKKVWDGISPDLQDKLRTIAVEESRASRDEIRSMGARALEAMKDRGLIVHEPEPAAVEAWRKVAESAYPSIRGEVVPAETFDRVKSLVTAHRAAKK